MRWPARSSHRNWFDVADFADAPAARRGIEKSGTSIPERRAPSDDAVIAGDSGRLHENAADPRHYPSSIHESETALERVGKNVRFRQQTDNDEGFEKVEEYLGGRARSAASRSTIRCLPGAWLERARRKPAAFDAQDVT